ncbi:MAG: FG-GAP-like repeat-containing protein [Pseudomonadota bacterium]|nr:FG-GAP-like repeat-containing protein [Pseudomonadota bacterium]
MNQSFRPLSVTFAAALFGLSGSAVAGEGAAGGWYDQVSARLRDAAHGFAADGDAFIAESPQRGITARFDAGAALLTRDGDSIAVRTTAWGRPGGMDPVPATPPQLGACATGREDAEGTCLQRLEYADAGLVEWWVGGAEGFEQGWVIAAPPAGEGGLTIDVAIDGATVTGGGGELWLEGDGGEQWIVSGLVAWDVRGTPLPADISSYPGGFRITVNDAGARYPIEIDPVYTTASTVLNGEAVANQFGCSVSSAGDVNGDGYDDVIVGAYGYGSGAGRAYVYAGSATGLSTTAATTLTGASAYTYFGNTVSGAGDVNGDGYDDVIVGAYGPSPYVGSAFVYDGSPSGVVAAASATLTGELASNYFGSSVSSAGDVNGDGFGDVIVGAFNYSGGAGRAYVYVGSASGVSTTASSTLAGDLGQFGYSVSGAGDVNGDGYDDVIVGAYNRDSSTGSAYVYAGSASGVATAASTVFTGEATSIYFGGSVSRAGDFNGDGYDDVIVGAQGVDAATGRAYVYAGSAGGLSTTPSATLSGESTANYFGASVSDAGDVDGDGYDDVIVGAFNYGESTGRAYLFPGSAGGAATSASAVLTGENNSSHFGAAVSSAGDVNGDGYDDVIAGAYTYGGETGRAYVHLGFSDADADGYAPPTDCDDTNAAINPEAAEVCNGVDDDCEGTIDAGALDAGTWYADADADGYVDPDQSLTACDEPDGYAALTEADCDDADAARFPGGDDVADDGIDQDCDGQDATSGDTDDTGAPVGPGEDDTGTETDAGCAGCGTTGGAGVGWIAALVGGLIVRRRTS